MIIDELDYIQHFGIKGQRWGVRKATNKTKQGERSKSKKPPRSYELAKDLALAGFVAAGTFWVGKLLIDRGSRNVSTLSSINLTAFDPKTMQTAMSRIARSASKG